MERKYRLAVMATHPIQYQVPLWRKLARQAELELTVLYGSDFGINKPVIVEAHTPYQWDIPLLEGYQYQFLRNISPKPSVRGALGIFSADLQHTLRRLRPDVLLVQGYFRLFYWQALWAAKRLGIKLLLRCDSSALKDRSGAHWRQRLLAWGFLQRVDGFLAIGARNREFYLSHGLPPERIYPAPYSVDEDFFQPRQTETKEALRRRLGLPVDRVLLLGVSTLTRGKGIHDVLDAYAQMPSWQRAAVVWVGAGPERAALEARRQTLPTGAEVHLVGFKNQTELLDYYAAADVFVLASHEEAWGLVLNEAMNFGLPVVTTDQVGAAIDLVADGDNGFVYPAGAVSELTKRMEALMEDARRLKMGQAARARIEQWSMAGTAASIVRAVEQTLVGGVRNDLQAGDRQ